MYLHTTVCGRTKRILLPKAVCLQDERGDDGGHEECDRAAGAEGQAHDDAVPGGHLLRVVEGEHVGKGQERHRQADQDEDEEPAPGARGHVRVEVEVAREEVEAAVEGGQARGEAREGDDDDEGNRRHHPQDHRHHDANLGRSGGLTLERTPQPSFASFWQLVLTLGILPVL